MSQNNHRNPAFLLQRIGALEQALHRQFALNGAAAEKIIRQQDELDTLGSYIIALVKRLGGPVEFAMEELQELAASDLEVNYSYPTPERPTFIMVLSAKGAKKGDARTEDELEAQLRAAGVSQEEIDAAKRDIAKGVEAAAELVGEERPPAVHRDDGTLGPPDPVPGPGVIVDPSGREPEAG